jgi:hypothetical protein
MKSDAPSQCALAVRTGRPRFPTEGWRRYCWRRAHKAAWKTPPREIALRRLARAEAVGMTYREYTLEILERGRHL